MLQEISLFNGNICDFEYRFGVCFSRETALMVEYNNFKSFHLLASEWVKQTVAPNKRILSFIATIDPQANDGGFAVVVLVNDASNFNHVEIWDYNSNVLQSGPIFPTGIPKYGGGPNPALQGIVDKSYKDVTVTKNPADNTIRIRGTIDISFLWGLFAIDLIDFDITINLTTLKFQP